MSSNQLDTTTVVVLILGTVALLSLLTMGIGFGGMMGGYGTISGGGFSSRCSDSSPSSWPSSVAAISSSDA